MANNTPMPITRKTGIILTKSIQFSNFLRYPGRVNLPVGYGHHLPQPAMKKQEKPVYVSCID